MTNEDPQGAMRTGILLGAVALSVCESLLLALQERGLLSKEEVDGLLEDVENAHRNVSVDDDGRAFHDTIVEVVGEIRNGGNSIRLLRNIR